MAVLDWLTGLRGIPADPDKIQFVDSPEGFYKLLLEKIGSAKKRIILSSLYLGTGSLEQALVDEVEKALSARPELKVGFLFDYCRGTRGGQKSSAGLLTRLADRVEAFFFHTPNLNGLLKKVLPERTNEVVGLQHMKFFVFDDSVIVSGANLSDTYFTNRQDRYVLLEDLPRLTNFFEALFGAVGSCSFRLKRDGTLEMPEPCHNHLVSGNVEEFKKLFSTRVNESLDSLPADLCESGTAVYPFLQMGPFGIDQERDLMRKLFANRPDMLNVTLASGYLNLFDEYSELMLHQSDFPMEILLASPQANGFHGAQGLSGYIPALYCYLLAQFHARVRRLGRAVALWEWGRAGWSFHAKGLWLAPGRPGPAWTATAVGSSNFGFRSTVRDLEAQLLIVTSDEGLRRRMREERARLFEHAQPVDELLLARPDHQVPLWVRGFAKVFRNFF